MRTIKYGTLVILVTMVLLNACQKDNDDIPEITEDGILYGIKHGDYYGYINSKGEIVLDSLDDGIIGEISGEFACKFLVSYEVPPGSFIPQPIFEWKWYYRDGSVLDMSRDYEYAPSGQGGQIELYHMYKFYDNRAVVARRGGPYNYLYGFVDDKGHEVIPCQYYWVSDFYDGIAAVWDTAANKVGYIDKQGNYLIEPQYDQSFYAGPYSFGFYDGKAVVSKEGIYYVIDKNNSIIADFGDLHSDYLNFRPSDKVSEGLLRFDVDGGSGFANMSGEWEIEPELKYYRVGDFVNDLAIVKIDSLPNFSYTYIDKSGNRFFSEAYGTVSEFDENGLAWVTESYLTEYESLNREGMFIDKTGNRAFPGDFSGAYDCRFVNDLALVYDRTQEVWKYINTSGETVLISPGDPITSFSLGASFVKPFILMYSGYFNSEGVALVLLDGAFGYINTSGEIIYNSQGSVENLSYADFLYE